MSNWYQKDAEQVLRQLGTDVTVGLSDREVSQRLLQHGSNELTEAPPKSPWLMLWEQLISTTILVLLGAAVLTLILGDYRDTVAIVTVVAFNAILGFSQEYRADQEFAALKQLAIPRAIALREGQWQEVFARHLVPGDIIQLEDGDQVPADARLLDSTNLRTQEAAFTGESESVEKDPATLLGDAAAQTLSERHNMVFMGTAVTYGRGRAVVTETGMSTEMGKIADSLQSVIAEPTPLQKRLDQLGRKLAIASVLLVTVIFGLGLFRGENLTEMFLTAVSLAVAVIPEGLPAVVTIALAIGSRRMLKRQALIRNLPAVETLGSVTTICADKTGTLTENRMTVTILALAGQRVDLRESTAQMTSLLDGREAIAQADDPTPLPPALALNLIGCALCNNVLLQHQDATHTFSALGDPTEIALVVAADRMNLQKSALETLFPRVAEIPFDSDRRRMTTVHQFDRDRSGERDITGKWQWSSGAVEQWSSRANFSPSAPLPLCPSIPPLLCPPLSVHRLTPLFDLLPPLPYIAFTKGAVSNLLDVSGSVWHEDHIEPMTPAWIEWIRTTNDRLAATGTRVLGIGFKLLEAVPAPAQRLAIEQDLVFAGLVGMIDPARSEAKTAVQTCQQAGIRTIMITGDHPLMAAHIATELNITSNGQYLTGQQLQPLSLAELATQVEAISVYARVSPQQKLKIVEALQQQGQIVAMTGDGVNDAPALSKANIGIAMGLTGTDVAKEAADMVLLNDNFSTIVAAVEEGRVIYDNIRKFIKYTLTGNASGVVIMVLGPLLAMPLPLEAIQILWINLLADGLLAIALSVEPAEGNVMQRSPYPPDESVFSRGVGSGILWVGTLMGLVFVWLGDQAWSLGVANWQTMVFSTLAFSRMSLALAMRSEHDLVIERGLLTNRPMLGAVLFTFILQLSAIYVPWLQDMFQTQALSVRDLLLCLAVSTIGFWAIELEKLIHRRHRR